MALVVAVAVDVALPVALVAALAEAGSGVKLKAGNSVEINNLGIEDRNNCDRSVGSPILPVFRKKQGRINDSISRVRWAGAVTEVRSPFS